MKNIIFATFQKVVNYFLEKVVGGGNSLARLLEEFSPPAHLLAKCILKSGSVHNLDPIYNTTSEIGQHQVKSKEPKIALALIHYS